MTIKILLENEDEIVYEVNPSLGLTHNKVTEEITIVNFDDGYEMLLQDYDEGNQIAKLILSCTSSIKEKVDEHCVSRFGAVTKMNRIKAYLDLNPPLSLKQSHDWVMENFYGKS